MLDSNFGGSNPHVGYLKPQKIGWFNPLAGSVSDCVWNDMNFPFWTCEIQNWDGEIPSLAGKTPRLLASWPVQPRNLPTSSNNHPGLRPVAPRAAGFNPWFWKTGRGEPQRGSKGNREIWTVGPMLHGIRPQIWPKIWYLHFRILELPLKKCGFSGGV